ncbi:uracil-DNA glycosylase (plasmid) [Rossellomorea sp. AcN35-11]|nr:uracil-DNA glycosylase [Rossellomorea aquimaris]WJV32170.1 uracil-DNA glycosylase [Rossellomorea sp. AcN35-11]
MTEHIVHSSWKELFSEQEVLLQEIEKKIGNEFTPSMERVFRFAELDLQNVKCAIFGKDPYPLENVATGRSFEVANVETWDDPKVNRSLQNVLKLLHKTYSGIGNSLTIDEVRNEIRSGKFPILPPDKIFSDWERKGVLFLNTALTTEIGKIGKHLKIWSPFFKYILEHMTSNNPRIVYFLWGDARKYKNELMSMGVPVEKIHTSYHPSSFYGDKGGFKNDGKFLHSTCFKDTFDQIKWV